MPVRQATATRGPRRRTWGNVTCWVSDTHMVITPSGRPYAELNPEDMVVVNFYTLAYVGNIKPSSELKLHCEVYKSRPHISAVIHTHQMYASIVAAAQRDVVVLESRPSEHTRRIHNQSRSLCSTQLKKDNLRNREGHPICVMQP
jgi:L-ribulose-5-phosphate 4-epimerase